MQTGSGPSPSRLPTVITAIAVVLAVIGLGGVVSGAADKPGDKVASTPTTDFDGDGGDSGLSATTLLAGTTTTTVAGGTSTTAKTTATTAKTTATTSSTGGPECGATATAAEPGASKAPAVGTYTYVTCADGKNSGTEKVAAHASDPKKRLVTQDSAGFEQTSTVLYGPNGVFEESFTVGGIVTCDWKPDLLEWPATVAVGATFSVDSSCTISAGQGATIHLTGTATIAGKVQMTIDGVTANAWSVNSVAKLVTRSKDKDGKDVDQQVDITATNYYDPSRGVDLFRHVETKGGENRVIIERLKSLTPKT